MGSTTHGLPYPDLGLDPPNGPAQIQALAEATDALITPGLLAPIGDPQYSKVLTATTVRLDQNANTPVLSSTFDLARDQYVLLGARLRAIGSGATNGFVGLALLVDSSVVETDGLYMIGTTDPNYRVGMHIETFSHFLTAGTHTVSIEGGRDGNNIVDVLQTQTLNGRTYRSATLKVIV